MNDLSLLAFVCLLEYDIRDSHMLGNSCVYFFVRLLFAFICSFFTLHIVQKSGNIKSLSLPLLYQWFISRQFTSQQAACFYIQNNPYYKILIFISHLFFILFHFCVIRHLHVLNDIKVSHDFRKFCFTPFRFYEKSILVPVFANRKKSEENFHFYEKCQKGKQLLHFSSFSAYGMYHGNALLWDSDGNLCL